MSIWLVTGASGFIGRHVLAQLREMPSVEVVALGRKPLDLPGVRTVIHDLEDDANLLPTLKEIQPNVVLHLAGKTPPASRDALLQANISATSNLLIALAGCSRPVRFVSTGSAAELGNVPFEDLPVGESYHAKPGTDYGHSKLDATETVLNLNWPISPAVARVFNPVGPGMPETQAFGRFARLLAKGSGTLELEAGDLSARRDFIDVRDVASAIIALAQCQETGLFHVGTGRSHSIKEGLDILSKLANRPISIKQDPTRSTGPSDSRADITRIRYHTSWQPKIPLEQSLTDLWESLQPGRG